MNEVFNLMIGETISKNVLEFVGNVLIFVGETLITVSKNIN